MAKKNDGGNSYTPIKNPELLQGKPETRTIQEIAAGSPKPEAKKETEKWAEQAKRTAKEKVTFFEKVDNARNQPTKSKEISKNEPEKDK